MARPPVVVDLFSGAGGFSLGFHAAGCLIRAAVDVDETAGNTFRQNFTRLQSEAPPLVLCGDEGNLEEVDLSRLLRKKERLDVLIGGPPCQGFSRVGRGKLNDLSEEGFAGDARNALYRRFLDAAQLWKPRAVVMENVPGMLSVEGRSVADEAASDLIKLGYRVGYAVLNAAWYGVPQYRERLFFIGLRQDLELQPSVPPTTHVTAQPSGYVATPEPISLFLPFDEIRHELSVDVRRAKVPATGVSEALDDLPEITEHLKGIPAPRGEFRRPQPYRSPPRSPYAQLMRRWPGCGESQGVEDHAIRRTPRDYETFARMRPGDRYAEARKIAFQRFEEHLEQLRSGGQAPASGSPEYAELQRRFVPPYPEHMFRDKWRKLIPDQPSWTVPAHLSKDSYSHIHYDGAQARAISIREAARLQSFPDAFAFTGNMGDCYRQIGNAVPPVLAWAIAAHLLELLGFPALRPQA